MSFTRLSSIVGATFTILSTATSAASLQPLPVPNPDRVVSPIVQKVTDTINVPLPNPPPPPEPKALIHQITGLVPPATIPEVPQVPEIPSAPPAPGPVVDEGPRVSDSYNVMCEQGGLRFKLGGGLLMLDPDTLQVTTISSSSALPPALAPVAGGDIPDRYQTANCSEDGGRTWGRVVLDFYVPNFGESSIAHTGYEDAILGGQDSDESYELPPEDEGELNDFFLRVSEFLAEPAEPVPSDPTVNTHPALPAPLYSVDVSFRTPTGQTVSTTAPGVIGLPTVVPITSSVVPDAVTVTISAAQDTARDGSVAASGYRMTIQRLTAPSVTATCARLQADVKVRLGLGSAQNPSSVLSPTGIIELGYQTIGVAADASAPSTFTMEYKHAAADVGLNSQDFAVNVTQVPSCGSAAALNVVGRFVDPKDPATGADDVNLNLNLAMPKSTNWSLARRTEAGDRTRIISTSDLPLGTLDVHGQNKGKQIDATIASIPESLDVCTDKGNDCNEPWRTDRASEQSFYIKARNAQNKPARMNIAYRESDGGGSTDLSIFLSDLAVDTYIGRLSWQEIGMIGVHGDYPKWFFLDTLGRTMGGYYHSSIGKHYLNVDIPSYGTTSWSRELVVDKKRDGRIKFDYWGDMSCSPGFSISMDIGGKIAGYLLGSSFCRAWTP